MTPEQNLMLQVQRYAGAALTDLAKKGHNEAFWAALTANESEGLISAKRFEAGVYKHFNVVKGGLHVVDRSPEGRVYTAAAPVWLAQASDDQVRALSTSWGWTQVMGYHAAEFRQPLDALQHPETHYLLAAELMAGFVHRWALDPLKNFEQMARCWNGGHPTAQTYDPHYVPNLLRRMDVWNALPARAEVHG